MADTLVAKQIVDVNTVVGFSTTPYTPVAVVFEMDDRRDIEQTSLGTVRVRQYPASLAGLNGGPGLPYYPVDTLNLKHVVTKGQFFGTNEWRVKYVSGTEVLTGDTVVEFRYPVVNSLDFRISADCYDIRGRPIVVTGYFDVSRNAIMLSAPCFGSLTFSYNTTYRIYRYRPSLYNELEVYLVPDPNDYGQLIGFHQNLPAELDPPAPAVFPIQPPQGIAAEFELYRIESTAFALDDGLYESPYGYPAKTTFPDDSSNTTITEADHGLEIARVHEIAYMSLYNASRRQASRGSERISPLPLDYNKELADEKYAGRKIVDGRTTTITSSTGESTSISRYEERQVAKREAFEKYHRMINQQPSMRIQRNEVRVAKPYRDTAAAINAESVRYVYCTKVTRDASGNVVSSVERRFAIVEEFKIKLRVYGGRAPTVTTEIFRDETNELMTDADTQMGRVNTMLSTLWAGIDWMSLRRMIRSSYDPELYDIIFDSSFPSNN